MARALVVVWLLGQVAQVGQVAPAFMLGVFNDDYAEQHTISASTWMHGTRIRYNIVEWHADKQFLIAQNDPGNRADGGKWSRFDWTQLPPSTSLGPGGVAGSGPTFTWAFCMTAYDEPTREAALAKDIAKRDTPKTGCNGFPFTRMSKAAK
jgi:hypothetical protein